MQPVYIITSDCQLAQCFGVELAAFNFASALFSPEAAALHFSLFDLALGSAGATVAKLKPKLVLYDCFDPIASNQNDLNLIGQALKLLPWIALVRDAPETAKAKSLGAIEVLNLSNELNLNRRKLSAALGGRPSISAPLGIDWVASKIHFKGRVSQQMPSMQLRVIGAIDAASGALTRQAAAGLVGSPISESAWRSILSRSRKYLNPIGLNIVQNESGGVKLVEN